jgi:pimeloyl-ACP methyl ester carboxylesterase
MKSLTAGLAGLFLTAYALCASPAAADSPTCTAYRLPVALSAGGPADQTVAATLCVPAGGAPQVDLLVAGTTYNSSYWDWPQPAATYSFVRRELAAGRATLAYDRIGSGASSRPLLSALVTEGADAHVTHQLVQWLRARPFGQVNLIGHSLGAIVAMTEAGLYADVNRVVVTSMLHLPGLGAGAIGLFGSFYPAALDPKFALSVTDLQYLTTEPGTRGTSFYHALTADPNVIAYDEAHKDVTSDTEVVEALTRLEVPAPLNDTYKIHVPVLVVMGQHDNLLCGLAVSCLQDSTVQANEAPYYASASSFTARTVPDTAHDLALHPSAGVSFGIIDQWLRTH